MVQRRALDGIRVVDFSWVRAGPWATRWLGALGLIAFLEQSLETVTIFGSTGNRASSCPNRVRFRLSSMAPSSKSSR